MRARGIVTNRDNSCSRARGTERLFRIAWTYYQVEEPLLIAVLRSEGMGSMAMFSEPCFSPRRRGPRPWFCMRVVGGGTDTNTPPRRGGERGYPGSEAERPRPPAYLYKCPATCSGFQGGHHPCSRMSGWYRALPDIMEITGSHGETPRPLRPGGARSAPLLDRSVEPASRAPLIHYGYSYPLLSSDNLSMWAITHIRDFWTRSLPPPPPPTRANAVPKGLQPLCSMLHA